MKKTSFIFTIILMSINFQAIASEKKSQNNVTNSPASPLAKIYDKDHHCLYGANVYSLGALLELKKDTLICEFTQSSMSSRPTGAHWKSYRS